MKTIIDAIVFILMEALTWLLTVTIVPLVFLIIIMCEDDITGIALTVLIGNAITSAVVLSITDYFGILSFSQDSFGIAIFLPIGLFYLNLIAFSVKTIKLDPCLEDW